MRPDSFPSHRFYIENNSNSMKKSDLPDSSTKTPGSLE
ncbi:hypothetical protein LEP1GSC168_2619 [Leptospira santarosai str. HAI134]|nr:hypothetical protein LEP1GSC168_2619 [Leptospira santarosai str. HAI134]